MYLIKDLIIPYPKIDYSHLTFITNYDTDKAFKNNIGNKNEIITLESLYTYSEQTHIISKFKKYLNKICVFIYYNHLLHKNISKIHFISPELLNIDKSYPGFPLAKYLDVTIQTNYFHIIEQANIDYNYPYRIKEVIQSYLPLLIMCANINDTFNYKFSGFDYNIRSSSNLEYTINSYISKVGPYALFSISIKTFDTLNDIIDYINDKENKELLYSDTVLETTRYGIYANYKKKTTYDYCGIYNDDFKEKYNEKNYQQFLYCHAYPFIVTMQLIHSKLKDLLFKTENFNDSDFIFYV